MRWILWAITLSMLLLGAVVIAGGLVSREHEIARTVELAAPPGDVFSAIADLEAMPAWRPEVVRVERAAGEADAPTYREYAVRGVVTWAVLESRPPARLEVRLAGAGPGFDGTWTFDLASTPGGTRLTLTERGEIDNPVFRFLSRFVVGYGKGMDDYLEALVRRLGPAAARSP
ncbi:MAG TPA: SRPBCC family protein [Haliangium sp.]|nr:SRPBCC family protein [Haliangium sp.]